MVVDVAHINPEEAIVEAIGAVAEDTRHTKSTFLANSSSRGLRVEPPPESFAWDIHRRLGKCMI
jgi:hypothetical protein